MRTYNFGLSWSRKKGVEMSLTLGRSEKIYFSLIFIVILGICSCSITAFKIVDLGFLKLPASNIYLSFLTFPIMDIITEIWGREAAKRAIIITFLAQIGFTLLLTSSLYLPPSTNWALQESYEALVGGTSRVLAASMVAYFCAQVTDVYIYAFLKGITKGKYIWLRNNISTMVAQFINSSLFITITFWGSDQIYDLIFGSILMKTAFALIDTPFVYAGIYLVRRGLGFYSQNRERIYSVES